MRRKLSTMLAAALAMTVIAIPAAADAPATIVDAVLADDGEFDVLQAAVIAVEEAEILPAVSLLSGEGPFTVFAPTDKAFAKLAEDLGAEDLESDDEVVTWLVTNVGLDTIAVVLGYHVVAGVAADSSTVVGLPAVTTLGGDVGVFAPGKGFRSIQFVDNDPDARNPKLVKGLFDLETGNGIIHGIDRVLRPVDL